MSTIKIKDISVGHRSRQADAAQVDALAASVAEVGLLNPITVYPCSIMRDGISVHGYGLVAGLHRLEACKRLGWVEIEANVVELSDLHRQLAECDENLCWPKLSPTVRALFTRRRKEIYEQLHPETRHGENQHTRSRRLGDSPDAERFTADTSARTGRSERDVQRDATRGEKIDGAVLSQITGTDMDKGIVLDELAQTPKEQQEAKVREIAERKSELRPAKTALVNVESAVLVLPPNEVAAREKMREETYAAMHTEDYDGEQSEFLGLPLAAGLRFEWSSDRMPDELLIFLGIKDVVDRYRADEAAAQAAATEQHKKERKKERKTAKIAAAQRADGAT
jgi:uncharacterized ParB-like nuclease family protein